MIGLEKHVVEVVEHCPQWAQLAAQACERARIACGHLAIDIQHVGSTAVPGLSAKPIIDLAVGVTELEVVPEMVHRLTPIGYIYRGDAGNDGGHLFVMESAPNVRTIHLHVVQHGDLQWRNYLAFRDLLLGSPAMRERYARLKRELGLRYARDRESYTNSKRTFIAEALRIARGERDSRHG